MGTEAMSGEDGRMGAKVEADARVVGIVTGTRPSQGREARRSKRKW